MPRRRKTKICFDCILEGGQLIEASRHAREENPLNAPIHTVPMNAMATPEPLAMAVETGKLWSPGRVLRVRFLDGHPTVQRKVEEVAHTWEQFGNIRFEFGNDPDAEIRVAFMPGAGSWSYIGTDALGIPKSQPTLNLGWLHLNTHNDEYNRVVTHEFGHALGCIHEHQSPAVAIPWDKPEVYRVYGGPPNNWSKAKVDVNLFNKYSLEQTQFSAFDPQSIMLYPISNNLTIGDFEVGWNNELSNMDKQYIGTVYPFHPKDEVILLEGADPTEAEIGAHAEEDLFRFSLAEDGQYTIETGGPTDVNMALYGPDDREIPIADDDDSGSGLNAKISQPLTPGTYFVRVRHFRPRGLGKYTISVKKSE